MTGNLSKTRGVLGSTGPQGPIGPQGVKGDTPTLKFVIDESTGDLYYTSDGILIDKEYADTNNYATKEFVAEAIASIVDSSPEALDTLTELAEALGNDPNFATTVLTEIGKKADKATSQGGFKSGENASAEQGGSVGKNATTVCGGSVGRNARSHNGGAVGWEANAGEGFSGGYKAKTEFKNGTYIDAIQLGTGINHNPKTLQVYDYTLLNEDGTIPPERTKGGFDYYYEFEDYDTYFKKLDEYTSSGLYKIKIKNRSEILLVNGSGGFEFLQLRISTEGYPSIERRVGYFYESDSVRMYWEDWDVFSTIGYVNEKIGDVESALDSIIAMQNELTGGGEV